MKNHHIQGKCFIFIQCILIVFTLFTSTVTAQVSKGSNNAQFGLGFSGIGLVATGYYVKGFNNVLFGQFGGGFEIGQTKDVGYRSMFVDAMLSTMAFSLDNRGTFNTTLGGGLSFYLDNIDDFPNDQTTKTVSGNYGVTFIPEFVMSMSRFSSLVMYSHLRYTIRPTFNVEGNFRYDVGLGLRFKI